MLPKEAIQLQSDETLHNNKKSSTLCQL